MAYTSAPELNSQKNIYVPAVAEGKNPSSDTLAGVLTENFLITELEDGPVLETRPATFIFGTEGFFAATASSVTAIYSENNFVFYSVFNGTNTSVYVTHSAGLVTNVLLSTVAGNQRVYFTSFTNIAGVTFVIWANGSNNRGAYNLSALTNTAITLTFATVGSPVFLDGFLFWARLNTNEIYQSDFDTPLTYTPGNFITANIESGIIVNLAKLRNHLVVFKTTGTEFFYNAGNPSGSVLSRNDSYFTTVNITGVNYIAYQDSLFFYGGDITSSRRALYQLSPTGTAQPFINPIWDNEFFFVGFDVNNLSNTVLSCLSIVEVLGNTYLVCNKTRTLADNRASTEAGYWFDLRRKVFLKQTIMPAFSWRISQTPETLFVSNINTETTSASSFAETFSGSDQIGLTTYTPIFHVYQMGTTSHGTLNFKTCTQIKIRAVRSSSSNGSQQTSWPTCSVVWSNNSGGVFANTARNAFASVNPIEGSRNDFIIRRLGRYRERSYRFAFIPLNSSYPMFRVYGFEFNIIIGNK